MIAIARIRNDSFFFNKVVLVHHPFSDCVGITEKRGIHRNFMKALRKLKVLRRCMKCWTDKQWNKALSLKITDISVDELLEEE